MPGSVGGRRKRVRTRGYLAGGLPCGGSRTLTEGNGNARDAGVNGLAPQVRVREMQTKLHRWAAADSGADPGRRFDDLYNLV
jgi:hypothetical protein